MPQPSTTDDYLELVAKSALIPDQRLEEYLARRRAEGNLPADAFKLAQHLVHDGFLTKYQAEQLLGGRWRNFTIGGKYKLLERLGSGGMAQVFLCEHEVMRRLVAVKILPTSHAEDKELLGRFHREARALSQLRHPNIVGAYDVDFANKVHFLVMEYVDGGDLDQIVQRAGPLAWERAAHYIRQSARGLQHAHERGLVHRDIKPGNVLVDRSGAVKLLDLGLARIFHEANDGLTTGRDAKFLLGTVDYLAPEQALNSHNVDIRADIYSLGATFYFLLAGKGLFEDGTIVQKLSWHLHRPPTPITDARPDVPEGLSRVIETMLAKRPEDRYQTPQEVDDALEPWTRTPVAPPGPHEFPQLSRAARGAGEASIARMASPLAKTLVSNPAGAAPRPVAEPPKTLASASPETPSNHPSIAPAPEPTPPPRRVPSWRKRARMAAMVAALLAIGAVGLRALRPSGEGTLAAGPLKSSNAGPVDGGASRKAPATPEVPPADRPSDASINLVSGSGEPESFPNLLEAVHAAKPGDRVVVRGSLVVDAIELSDAGGITRDLTIEGVNEAEKGRPVRWRGPLDLSAGRALVDVSGLEGFRLKGFLFDGQGRVAELVRLHGRGGDSTLEDLQFSGADRSSIVLRGWSGEEGRPATIRRAWFSTEVESESAIQFETDPDRPEAASVSVRVESCRFVGPFQAALMVAGPVDGLDVERCRFFRGTDGLRYRRTEARVPLRARLANNTFVEMRRGLRFETTPPSSSSELVVANNVFASTTRLTMLDRVSVQPPRVAGSWIWTEEGQGTSTVPAGDRHFRKTFEVSNLPEKATLDISVDDGFTAWINGSEVARSPSMHYTQRVFSFDVTNKLQPGRNVLAILGTNRPDRLDPKAGTTAGLLAQVTSPGEPREAVLVKTDETWKCADRAPEGWTLAEFDDQSWTSARRWQDDGAARPWKFAVWDSAVASQIRLPLEPIQVRGSGNVRDYKSWEGYPTIDSERVALRDGIFSKDPGDDPKFLRYPENHPLASAGPGRSPVGAAGPN